MRRFLLFVIFVFYCQFSFSQRGIGNYIHHVEMGTLHGTDEQGSRVNFSLQSFHGAQIDSHHQIGFFVGYDTYPEFNLMPVGFGWRYTFEPERKYSFYTNLDLGYGSAWFQGKEIVNRMQSWNEGGFMLSPALGLRKRSKTGNHAYTAAIGFKKQYAYSYVGQLSAGGMPPVDGIRPGFDSLFEESLIFNNLFIRLGMIF
ncbi:hypothetical protein ACFSKL_20120 [Belliella marina]|uniref:Outer membrane protein beta-barrel domain-containing protein n=1 Tax=Belliella marina TaxID=1644146 RepID=A0ABW4VSH0_9BACT